MHIQSLISPPPPKKREREREGKKFNANYFWPSCIRECACIVTICCVSVTICKMCFTLKPYAMPAIFTLDLFLIAIDPNTESVEDLMQRFQDSFRVPNTPTDMSHYQHVMHSSLTGRRRVPSHTRGRTKSHSKSFQFCWKNVTDLARERISNICMFSLILQCILYNVF